jgi:cytochrome b6-f complex iron-sulfur subunit
MNRKDFIKLIGTGSLAACAGCLNQDYSFPQPGNVDFYLNIEQADNSVLQSPGGWLSKNGVVIVHLQTGGFVAFSRVCSHQGGPIQFQPSQNNLICNRHYSAFDLTDFPINGPATKPLRKFKAELTGNLLHVSNLT